METVFNPLNKLQFWMDEQRLHMYSEAHSNTMRRRVSRFYLNGFKGNVIVQLFLLFF